MWFFFFKLSVIKSRSWNSLLNEIQFLLSLHIYLISYAKLIFFKCCFLQLICSYYIQLFKYNGIPYLLFCKKWKILRDYYNKFLCSIFFFSLKYSQVGNTRNGLKCRFALTQQSLCNFLIIFAGLI